MFWHRSASFKFLSIVLLALALSFAAAQSVPSLTDPQPGAFLAGGTVHK